MMTYIKLALGLVQLANWIAGQVSRAQWEASGFQKAANQYAAQFAETTGAAKQAFENAKKMTPEERKRILEGE